VNDLQQFLDERNTSFGTLQNLARLMRVTFSGFLRGVKSGTLSAENCLRLAEVLGEEPAAVFRAAHKPELADQFERLYGKVANPMSAAELEILALWRTLTPRAREGLRLTMSELPRVTEAPSQTAQKKGRRSRG
jgi:hypothetical protein